MKNKLTLLSVNNLLLWGTISIAAICRFWNFSEIQLMHDELSGLLRAQLPTLTDVINETKQTDVHPVGVPAFIHYWTNVFGNTEQALKFPFIIMSLFSIFFVYKIAEKWFNATVGIITSAFMASIQFTTMYGQLARPYSSGIFFSVLMVWFFINFFDTDELKKENKNLIAFIIASVLCAYNHYFSLLFAMIVWATGLFFINKKNYLKYLFSGIAIILFCLPQIPVLEKHFLIGGASESDWLEKPESNWLWVFIKYLFHYSRFVYAVVLILFIFGFLYFDKSKKIIHKHRIVLLAWSILPFLIIYTYSIYKSPVLQFSSMTFSIPFACMLAFSFYKDVTPFVKTSIVAIIIFINLYTLSANRKHFDLFYKQPYDMMAKISLQTMEEYGKENVSIAHDLHPRFMPYYFNKYNSTFNYFNSQNKTIASFKEYLLSAKTPVIVCGNLPLEFIQLAKQEYPYMIRKEQGFTYNIYCFSKQAPFVKEAELTETILYERKYIFKSDALSNSTAEVNNAKTDTTLFFKMDSNQEYGYTYHVKLKNICTTKHAVLNMSASVNFTDSATAPVLVMDISDKGKSLLWKGGERIFLKNNFSKNDFLYVSQLLSDNAIVNHPDAELKVYVWNRNKNNFDLNYLKIEIIESNPFVYGLYEPF